MLKRQRQWFYLYLHWYHPCVHVCIRNEIMAIKKRKERLWMKWLHSITDSMDMNLSKLWEIVENRGAWHAAVHGVTESRTWLRDSTTAIPVCKLEKQGSPSVGTVPGATLQLWNPPEAQGGDPHGNISMKSCFVALCVLSYFSCVWLLVTLWTVAQKGPASFAHGILQTRILEWVAVPSSPEIFLSRKDQTSISYVSGIGRQVFYH